MFLPLKPINLPIDLEHAVDFLERQCVRALVAISSVLTHRGSPAAPALMTTALSAGVVCSPYSEALMLLYMLQTPRPFVNY